MGLRYHDLHAGLPLFNILKLPRIAKDFPILVTKSAIVGEISRSAAAFTEGFFVSLHCKYNS